MSDHSEVMNAANARGLTFNGVMVRASGNRLDYALVTITDSKHPFNGWQTEYAWPTIQRATETGVLR